MRKIAMPINGENLHGHFGGAGLFRFYIVENNKVVNVEMLPPPPHAPGVIPKWVVEMGASEIILGGIGEKAVSIFEHYNVKVVKGAAESNADSIIEKYLAGTLETSEENCNHDHHHDHGDHNHHHHN